MWISDKIVSVVQIESSKYKAYFLGGVYFKDMGSEDVRRDTQRKRIGRLGEDIAIRYLQRHGFDLIERNYRKPWGEIDIIAQKKSCIRFIEVKSISRENNTGVSCETLTPEDHITTFKLEKVARTATLYMQERNSDLEYQIDVVAVFIDRKTRIASCRLYEQVL